MHASFKFQLLLNYLVICSHTSNCGKNRGWEFGSSMECVAGMRKALGSRTSTEKKQNSLKIEYNNQVFQQITDLTDCEKFGMILSEDMKTPRPRNGPEVYPAAR